jgi:hypothetical protein
LVSSGTVHSLNAVWGATVDSVWAVGHGGAVLRRALNNGR